MSTSSATRTGLPRGDVPTESQQRWEAVGPGGARKPPKRARTVGEKRAEDTKAAAWFDAGVAAFPKAGAYAEELGLDDGDLSNMRSGKIAVALRRLLPMQAHAPSALAFCETFLAEVNVAEHPDEVLALVAPLLDEIGMVARHKGGITPAQIGEIATRLLCDGRASREMLERECHRVHGASPDEIAVALRREDDEP
jgi:hypothetical protein